MSFASRTLPRLSCAACCALVGCCLAPKHHGACNNCAPSAIAEVPTTYENYTPPQPMLKPVPGVELPPLPDDQTVLPPPQTRSVPDGQFDFFEPSNASRPQSDAR